MLQGVIFESKDWGKGLSILIASLLLIKRMTGTSRVLVVLRALAQSADLGMWSSTRRQETYRLTTVRGQAKRTIYPAGKPETLLCNALPKVAVPGWVASHKTKTI